MEVFFTTPKTTVIYQGDVRNQHLYIIGDGYVDVQSKYSNVFRDTVCELESGAILNEIATLFNCAPTF